MAGNGAPRSDLSQKVDLMSFSSKVSRSRSGRTLTLVAIVALLVSIAVPAVAVGPETERGQEPTLSVEQWLDAAWSFLVGAFGQSSAVIDVNGAPEAPNGAPGDETPMTEEFDPEDPPGGGETSPVIDVNG